MGYIMQLRRGTKDQWQAYEAEADHIRPYAGELVVEYDITYEQATTFEPTTIYYTDSVGTKADPQPELVDFNSGTYYKKKVIPRLKIGTGEHEFSALPYISVDSFVLPKPTEITLIGSNAWTQDIYETDDAIPDGYNIGDPIPNRYYQVVDVPGVTKNSKIDLQPTPEQLTIFHEKDVTFTAVNDEGNITVYAIGVKPISTYNIPITVTEVVI